MPPACTTVALRRTAHASYDWHDHPRLGWQMAQSAHSGPPAHSLCPPDWLFYAAACASSRMQHAFPADLACFEHQQAAPLLHEPQQHKCMHRAAHARIMSSCAGQWPQLLLGSGAPRPGACMRMAAYACLPASMHACARRLHACMHARLVRACGSWAGARRGAMGAAGSCLGPPRYPHYSPAATAAARAWWAHAPAPTRVAPQPSSP